MNSKNKLLLLRFVTSNIIYKTCSGQTKQNPLKKEVNGSTTPFIIRERKHQSGSYPTTPKRTLFPSPSNIVHFLHQKNYAKQHVLVGLFIATSFHMWNSSHIRGRFSTAQVVDQKGCRFYPFLLWRWIGSVSFSVYVSSIWHYHSAESSQRPRELFYVGSG